MVLTIDSISSLTKKMLVIVFVLNIVDRINTTNYGDSIDQVCMKQFPFVGYVRAFTCGKLQAIINVF